MAKKIFIIMLLLLLAGCNLPAQNTGGYSPLAVSQLLVTADPYATQTPTPFQPVAPTDIVLPTSTPEVTEVTTVADNGASQPVVMPEGQINILILGSDYRENSGFRTDTIVFMAINPKKGTVRAVSFPRDLYIDIPGYGTNRINTAFQHGWDTLVSTFEYNFGISPDYYVMTNMEGFKGIIDSLGGIDVDTAVNLYDTCKLYFAYDGYCSVGPGIVHMDSETALWYVRSRYSTSDLDRGRRAMEVLKAIFVRMMQMDALNNIPTLYDSYINSVETNISLDVILPMISIAPKLLEDELSIYSTSVGAEYVTGWMTEEGASVLLPDLVGIRELCRTTLLE